MSWKDDVDHRRHVDVLVRALPWPGVGRSMGHRPDCADEEDFVGSGHRPPSVGRTGRGWGPGRREAGRGRRWAGGLELLEDLGGSPGGGARSGSRRQAAEAWPWMSFGRRSSSGVAMSRPEPVAQSARLMSAARALGVDLLPEAGPDSGRNSADHWPRHRAGAGRSNGPNPHDRRDRRQPVSPIPAINLGMEFP